MKIRFFGSAAAFGKWLEANHVREKEILLGLYKKDSGRKGITYAGALDEALSYGWIDGVRRTLDGASYSIRFTPRKPGSIWSRVNLAHVERLKQANRMQPAGIKIHAERVRAKEGTYSFENAPRDLPKAYELEFQSDGKAWKFFRSQAPSYQRVAIWWVVSAKKEETRVRRLKQLIEASACGQRPGVLI